MRSLSHRWVWVLVGAVAAASLPARARPPESPPRELAPEVRAFLSEARSLGLYAAPRSPVLSPGLAALARSTPQRQIKVWVFLTDKGVGRQGSYERALRAFEERLGERARRRRASLGSDLRLDFTDLPVFEPYVSRLGEEGFQVRRRSRWLNAVSIETGVGRLPELAVLPFVRHVQPLLVSKRPPEPPLEPLAFVFPTSGCSLAAGDSLEAAFYGKSFHQNQQIDVDGLHRLGYSGAGVRVMVIDTGFRKDHPVFSTANLIAEWDFVNEDGNTQNETGDPGSQHDHGTGVWGVLGGYDPGELVGPAFAAEFVLAKTEDVFQEIRAEEDNYVAALEWGDTLGVEVTSASLSYLEFDDSTGYTPGDLDGNTAVITVAVDIAASKGICCVNSIGNFGPSPASLWTPSDADSVIAVGAVDSCGVLAGFSSRGPTADDRIKPEVCAQGVQTHWAEAWSMDYGPANGTSLSSPLIGGLAALLKEAHPDWTGVDIREALIGTATQATSPDNDLGYGIARGLDALGFSGSTLSPPRMTLPFHLLAPAHEEVVTTVRPTLRWTASLAANLDDEAVYRVLLSADSSFTQPDTLSAGTDTTYALLPTVPPGEKRWWRVEAVGEQGYVRRSMNVHSFSVDQALTVTENPEVRPVLGPAVPNPTSGPASFRVQVPQGEPAVIEIISVTGRLVRGYELVGTGGEQRVRWDGRDEAGREVPSGVYFYRLATRDQHEARRIIRLP